MGGNGAVVGAVITAAVAVIVAIATQVWTSLRSRSDRQYAARRAGLVEAQDAVLELREALAAYGPSLRTAGRSGPASSGTVDSAALPKDSLPPSDSARGRGRATAAAGASTDTATGSPSAQLVPTAGTAGVSAVSAPGSFSPEADPDLEAQRRRTAGRFEVCVSRVHDEVIVSAMTSWQSAASRRFISTEEVTASAEEAWFAYVQQLCHLAITSSQCTTSKASREGLSVPETLPE